MSLRLAVLLGLGMRRLKPAVIRRLVEPGVVGLPRPVGLLDVVGLAGLRGVGLGLGALAKPVALAMRPMVAVCWVTKACRGAAASRRRGGSR